MNAHFVVFYGLLATIAAVAQPAVSPMLDMTAPVAGNIMRAAAADAAANAPVDTIEPLDRPFASLKNVQVPAPADISVFIRNNEAALVLGKSLFWDMQAGSDGVTACATCHYHAGADTRSVNTIAPALLQVSSKDSAAGRTTTDHGINTKLTAADFPIHRLADPRNRQSQVLADSSDIVGSQGVLNEAFQSITPRRSDDQRRTVSDTIFSVKSSNTRRVTPRNSPSVINAVFNLRNFWDGRAQDVFNGVNPFGARDKSATVLRAASADKMDEVRIRLTDSSLASQAVGPPLSDIEMSAAGRSFAHLGRKLLGLRPLALQKVHPQDSVLGTLVHVSGKGLNVAKYQDLIQQAFAPEWWQGQMWIEQTASGATRLIPAPVSPGPGQFSQMAWNFSLYFGLAIQVYESTLISDETPFDRFMEGDHSALSPQQQIGMELFTNKASCAACHSGPEFTNASVGMAKHMRNERMVFASLPADPANAQGFINTSGRLVVYDTGFYNIGVRPITNDLGIGNTDPFGYPLSEARLAKEGRSAELGLPAPTFTIDERMSAAGRGAFKAPGLRNVELTAPYFHNGGQLTLRQVVDFYNRGGDFREANITEIPVDITELGLTEYEKEAIVAFLQGLTDPRVKFEKAPFDHPQLLVPNGHPSVGAQLLTDAQGRTASSTMEIPAVGRLGGPPQPNFLAPP
jgi:cytochrome c peroxidase